MSKRIVLLGPPGCGKGTQSKLLVEKNQFIQLSTGDLLRAATNNIQSKVGQKIKTIMGEGKLVPDNYVIDIIINKVSELKNRNIIFDGFPRNIEQAIFLDDSLKDVSMKLDYVIFFKIDYEVLENRIKKRIEESNVAEQRSDDNLETLSNRINTYKKSTLPIVEFYKDKGILFEIDGMEEIENVYENILKIIQ